MSGETYSRAYSGGWVDGPSTSTPIVAAKLNAMEDALVRLLGEDPADAEIPVWSASSARFVFRSLTTSDLPGSIPVTKLASGSDTQVLTTSGSTPTWSSLTTTQIPTLGYSKLDLTGSIVDADVASSAAIQYGKLNLNASVSNPDIAASAGITYAKLDLTGSVKNADVASNAAIGYSKLNLGGGVTNADIDSAAAIAESKLNLASDAAAGTASRRTLSTTGTSACAGNDARLSDTRTPTDGSVTNAKVNASAAIAYSKLNLGTSIVNADVATGAAIAYSKLSLGTSIVNADVSASAAIAYSKLNLGTSIVNADVNSGAAIARSKLDFGSGLVNADVATGAAIAYSKLSLGTSIVNADVNGSAAIDESKLNLASDAAAGTASRRTLSTTSTSAAAGNDYRINRYQNIQPSHHGMLGWTVEPALVVNTLIPVAGTIYYSKCYLPPTAVTIAYVWYVLAAVGGAGTNSNWYFGIYNSSGTRLGLSAERSGDASGAAQKQVAITVDGGQSLTVGGTQDAFVYIGMVFGSVSASITISRASSAANANFGLSALPYRFMNGATSQTSLPTGFTPTSGTGQSNIVWLLGIA